MNLLHHDTGKKIMKKRKKKTKIKDKNEQRHLKKLQELTESQLEQLILIPLFIGPFKYDSVDKFGGPDEHGIDLICWKKDEIDEIEVAVVQVKRFKPARRSSSNQSFAGLLNQISQASEERIPHTNGNVYLPRILYFVTPYPIDTRTLKTRFEKVSALKQQGLKIIDGEKLLYLTKKHLPKIARQLMQDSPDIKGAISDCLNNNILLNALKSQYEHKIKDFYTDIDFTVGNINTRIFLQADFRPNEKELNLDESEWKEFKKISYACKKMLGFSLSSCDYKKIEYKRENSSRMKRWKNIVSQRQAIKNNIVAVEKERRKLHYELSEISLNLYKISPKNPLSKDINEFISGIQTNESIMQKVYFIRTKKFKKLFDAIEKDPIFLGSSIKSLGNNAVTKFKKIITKIEAEGDSLTLKEKLDRESPPTYPVKINATRLCRSLLAKRKLILGHIKLFKEKKPTQDELKNFLQTFNPVLSYINLLFSKSYVRESILTRQSTTYIRSTEFYRFQISVHQVFDLGLNTVVLGEAGAGKTTSLQMYAILQEDNRDKVVFYTPLAWLTSSTHSEYYEGSVYQNWNDPQKLYHCGLEGIR